MKTPNISQDNHYTILHLAPGASAAEIVQAYREIKLIFQPDSLAAYSLYAQDELEHILADIEEAYVVLSDSDKRQSYDKAMNFTPPSINHDVMTSKLQPAKSSIAEKLDATAMSHPSHINGKKLKKIRKTKSITLDEVASLTKISKSYLKAIEADDFSSFPAPIYTKSYLKQYAAAIGVEPELVLQAYKATMNANPTSS